MAMASTSSFTLSSFVVPTPKSLPQSFHSLPSSPRTLAPATDSSFSVRISRREALLGALLQSFVRIVAVSSEDDQEDDEESFGEPQFSVDLKLFVGNLPFNVDSAQLANLFESAGTVEMVELLELEIPH